MGGRRGAKTPPGGEGGMTAGGSGHGPQRGWPPRRGWGRRWGGRIRFVGEKLSRLGCAQLRQVTVWWAVRGNGRGWAAAGGPKLPRWGRGGCTADGPAMGPSAAGPPSGGWGRRWEGQI